MPVKITDVRCANIGRNPVIRIVTDQGISGYAQAESGKANVKPLIPYYKPYLLGEDAQGCWTHHAKDPPHRGDEAMGFAGKLD